MVWYWLPSDPYDLDGGECPICNEWCNSVPAYHEQIRLQREVWDLGHAIGSLPCRERMEKPHNRELMASGCEPTEYWNLYWRWKADQRANTQRTHFIHSLVAYEKLKDVERFHWVWFSDNRGRKYQRGSQLNYLGNDSSRSQILFDPHLH